MEHRGLAGCREVAEDVALLLAQGLSYGEHALDEAAARRAMRAEADFAPEHAMAQCPFGRVIPRPGLCRVDEVRRRPSLSGLQDRTALHNAA